MSKGLVLVGGGGHCASVIGSLDASLYDDVVIVDKKSDIDVIAGIRIVGDDSDLPHLLKQGYTDAFITMNTVGKSSLSQMLVDFGFHLINIIDPSAEISSFTSFGTGIFVGKKAVVNTNATIGNCSIINTGAIIEHDCLIGSYCHIAPGAIVCGSVNIGDNTHIGAGSCIRQNLKIGSNTIVGMGSVVVKDIGNHKMAYGNPCSEVERDA